MEKQISVHIAYPIEKSPVCVSKKETALLFTGTSTRLKAQKNLWKGSVNL